MKGGRSDDRSRLSKEKKWTEKGFLDGTGPQRESERETSVKKNRRGLQSPGYRSDSRVSSEVLYSGLYLDFGGPIYRGMNYLTLNRSPTGPNLRSRQSVQ